MTPKRQAPASRRRDPVKTRGITLSPVYTATVYRRLLFAIFVLALAWSAIHPHDYFTWWLEVFPALIGVVLVVATARRFPLTALLLTLLLIHAIILMIGGHYTYAEVPLGFWMERAFGFARNDYDRIGHFAQGFVPAVLAREILIRRDVVRKRGWLFVIVVAICLAVSAMYELLEWQVAVHTGSKGDAFLGTQGDIWDTQEDMATALVGAITASLFAPLLHDRQIAALDNR
jgi:putative membrane protein